MSSVSEKKYEKNAKKSIGKNYEKNSNGFCSKKISKNFEKGKKLIFKDYEKCHGGRGKTISPPL